MNSIAYRSGQKKSLPVLDSKLLSEAMIGFHAAYNLVERHGIFDSHFKRVNVITIFYLIDFQGSNTGRPPKLKKGIAIQFFLEYGKSDYMKYALKKVGICRSAAWRWKNLSQAVDAMYRLALALNDKKRTEFPFCWKRIRKQRIRLSQQKRRGVSLPSRNSIRMSSAYMTSVIRKVEPVLSATDDRLCGSKRTVITWMDTYLEFRNEILLKLFVRLLPIFEKQCDLLEVEFAHSLAYLEFDKENPNEI